MALPTSEVKFDMNLIGHIPILTGQDNYDMWRLRIQTTLSAYSVWEFVDDSLTYTAQADAANRLQWKLLDKCVLGLMASTISDSLLTHVNYEWTDPVVCPSILKALWDILRGLFGTVGIPGQFNLFYQALRLRIDPENANSSINEYHVHFQKLVEAGYNLPETLRTMILLSGLPTNYFALTSTITQIVDPVNFNMSTISKWILMDMDLCATRKPLHAWISQAESRGQSSSTSVNRTNVIKCSPPPQNQWRSQTPSYQLRSFDNQPSGGYSNQPQLGSANPNQRKNSGPAKSKRPGKNQKKDWFKQRQNAKGKGKAANEVTFANEVVVELEQEYVEEHFLSPSFLKTQGDYDMGDSSSTVVHAGWDEEDSGMNVAGPSSMPFRYGSFKECPF